MVGGKLKNIVDYDVRRLSIPHGVPQAGDDGRINTSWLPTGYGGWHGTVTNYDALPAAGDHINEVYLVEQGSYTYLIFRKPSGLYLSDGASWHYLGRNEQSFYDSNFKLVNAVDNSKVGYFDLSEIDTATTRSWKFPNKNGTFSLNKDNTVTVDQGGGGDFDSIQDAIDSITTAAEGSAWAVIVSPGLYTEDIELKDWVDLEGRGSQTTIIDGTISWLSADNTTDGWSSLNNIGLEKVDMAQDEYAIVSQAGNHDITNCYLYAYGEDVSFGIMDQSGGNVGSYLTAWDYYSINDVTTATPHRIIRRSAGSLNLYYSEFVMWSDDDGQDMVVLDDTAGATGEDIKISSNVVDIYNYHGTYTGDAIFLRTVTADPVYHIIANHIHMISEGGGDGYGYYIDTGGNLGLLTSTASIIVVQGFANNYFGFVDTTDVLNSSMDTVDADAWTTGVGTVNIVASSSPGNITISGSLDDNQGNSISIADLVQGATDIYPFDSGEWYDNSSHGDALDAISTVQLVAGTIYAVRFRVTRLSTFDRISIEKTAGTGTQFARIAIYDSDGNRPDNLLIESASFSFDTNTTYPQTINQQLVPGLYWLAIQVSGARTVRAFGAIEGISMGYVTEGTTTKTYRIIASQTYGAFPVAFPSASLDAGQKPPRMMLRAL